MFGLAGLALCADAPVRARARSRCSGAARLPLVRDAFAHGELSYTKVRALTRVATAENEESCWSWPVCHRCSAGAGRARLPAGHDRGVARSPGGRVHGCVLGAGRVAGDPRAAQRPRTERCSCARWRRCATGSGDRPAVPRNRDPSGRRCARRRWSRSPSTPRPHRRGPSGRGALPGRRPRRRNVLSHDGDGACELDEGSALAPETARRLACDASLVRNGRKTRAIRLQCAVRCARATAAAASRLQTAASSTPTTSPLGQSGPTHMGNLLLLYRHHHRLVHEGGYRVDRHGRFYDPAERTYPTFHGCRAATLGAAGAEPLARDQRRHLRPRHRRPDEPRVRSRRSALGRWGSGKNRAGRLSNPESP